MPISNPTVVDLFSGCGGISSGFSQAGFDVRLGLDIEPDCLDTFALNHPGASVLLGDIAAYSPDQILDEMRLDPGELDCLAGGPPCQSFSKNVPASRRFFEDERNHLYKWFLDVAELARPKTILIENVAELWNAHDGQVRREIYERLEAIGYSVDSRKILAAEHGVPQRRRRVIFMASRLGSAPEFPVATHLAKAQTNPDQTSLVSPAGFVTVRDAISDLPEVRAGQGTEIMAYATPPQNEFQRHARRNSETVRDHEARALSEIQLARIQAMKPGQRMRDLPPELQTKDGYGGAYGRLEWDKPALTITTWVFHPGSGRFGHPTQDRTITMREAARIQSFPDSFHFTGSYNSKARQIGNAVPPLLAEQLARSIQTHLAQNSGAQEKLAA